MTQEPGKLTSTDFRSHLFPGAEQGVPGPKRCIVIGEVAQAHDGSLGTAHAFIDAIARAGADAVKFQTHIAEAESTPSEAWRVKFSKQDATRYEYWRRMELTPDQWHGLKTHAEDRGLLFLSSPFSEEAVDLLASLGIKAWKVASGEVSNERLLRKMASTKLPIILSSGMSSIEESDRAVELVTAGGLPLAVLQCTSSYPCAPEDVGLNMLDVFRRRYKCAVGLSDHSGTIYPGLAAATLGAEVLEVHVTLSREMFGPDVTSSVTTSELAQLVEGVRFVERMTASPVNKNSMAANMEPMRKLFTRSVTARTNIAAGTTLEEKHLALKKPGTGIPASQLQAVVGRTANRDIEAGTLLREEDFS